MRTTAVRLVVAITAVLVPAVFAPVAEAGNPPRIELKPDYNDASPGAKGTTKFTAGPMAGPGAAGGTVLGEDAATATCRKEASSPACDVTTVIYEAQNVPPGGTYWDKRSGTLRARVDWQDPSGSSDLDMYAFRKPYPGEKDEEGNEVTSDVFVIGSAKDNTELGQPGPNKFEEFNIPEPETMELYVYVVSWNGQVPRVDGLVEVTTGLVRTFDRSTLTTAKRNITQSADSGSGASSAAAAPADSQFVSQTPGGVIINTERAREIAQANPGSVFVGRAESLRLRGASARRVEESSQTGTTIAAAVIAAALFGIGGFLVWRRLRRRAPA